MRVLATTLCLAAQTGWCKSHVSAAGLVLRVLIPAKHIQEAPGRYQM